MDNLQLLDNFITGRVEPHIYAFTTDAIPGYLKVGDTYRPVSVRLKEWKKHFPDLVKAFEETAAVTPDIFFRDFSVRQFLELGLGKHRLTPGELPAETYYSKEFFKDTKVPELEAAIHDIRRNHQDGGHRYQYYHAGTNLPEVHTYASSGWWEPRPMQAETVRNFKAAVGKGRTNLLMYAVMRFGKSFTALCCAKEMAAKTVLVVSAKADVREEWKKTVQSADNFREDYAFLTAEELNRDENAIKRELERERGVVIFLTLQDLQGESIKEKHREVFSRQIDLLIVDETHYGARAESYGKILRTAGYEKDVRDRYLDEDFVELEEAEEQLKALQVKITLHLSGTPYRILMGSEFSEEDIITFCQFSDIVKEQEAWDLKNDALPEGQQEEEWKNPYFGFPQMVRFAFAPSSSALALLESLKSSGITYAFSALLKPESLSKKKDGSHKRFVHEREVLELFEAIDGSRQDDGVLGFLDYDRIKEGKMCRHMVCVLPYCASCDALESLLVRHASSFKNLGQYKVINISDIDRQKQYKNVTAVKKAIADCEKNDQKTITLTVNRMLTGSTVEQWDTMIFLKDTASPQEYDQAIFRLQNQYIRKYENNAGETICYNMKPQTLLVDFDPHRMFVMQEQKSLIYNANTKAAGNGNLRQRMEEELRISPIITLNKNRIEQVTAVDILAEISRYSSSRGVRDEAQDLPVDTALFSIEEILREIERKAEIGSKGGLQTEAHRNDTDGTDLEEPEHGSDNAGRKEQETDTENEQAAGASQRDREAEIQSLENKFKTYYSRVLFFAFLTEETVSSLDDILACADSEDNTRIMRNLQLDGSVLELMRNHMNPFILNALDYKIQNINKLSHDDTVPSLDRALIAMNKFGKLSESEVTTPVNVAAKMLRLIPDSCFEELVKGERRILDLASKAGEFAIAICERCRQLGIPAEAVRGSVWSIPTSSVAYEFTRKMYQILGLSTETIAGKFHAYNLLNVVTADGKVDYKKIAGMLSQRKALSGIALDEGENGEGNKMLFNAVVGNPPYQESDGGAQASARALYPYFVNIARELAPDYVSVIIPTRWFAGGKHLDSFRTSMLNDVHIKELHDCLHPEEIFPDTNNRGGICYFLWDARYDNQRSGTRVVTHEAQGRYIVADRPLKTRDLDIFIRNSKALSILDKVIPDESTDVMSAHISPRRPFALDGNFTKSPEFYASSEDALVPIKCYGKARTVGYVERDLIKAHTEWIDRWKVYMPYANNIGTELNDDNQNTFIGEPESVCTETFLMAGHDLYLNEKMCRHLADYLRTKFARFLLSLAKISQHGTAKTYRFVPVQDFREEWTDERLYAKYSLTEEEIAYIEKSIKRMD